MLYLSVDTSFVEGIDDNADHTKQNEIAQSFPFGLPVHVVFVVFAA